MFNGHGSKAKIALRKITWAAFRAEDALRLEQRLQSHLDALHRYLTAVTIRIQAQSAEKANSKLERIHRALDVIHTLIKISQENRPRTLGYSWETDMASHIEFEDALGRKVILPDVLCRSAQSFQDTARIMFANHPGYQMIVEGNYEIVDAEINKAILHSASNLLGYGSKSTALHSCWEQCLLPETKLAMNIINKRRLRDSPESLVPSVSKDVPCPNCGWQSVGRGLREWYATDVESSVR